MAEEPFKVKKMERDGQHAPSPRQRREHLASSLAQEKVAAVDIYYIMKSKTRVRFCERNAVYMHRFFFLCYTYRKCNILMHDGVVCLPTGLRSNQLIDSTVADKATRPYCVTVQ